MGLAHIEPATAFCECCQTETTHFSGTCWSCSQLKRQGASTWWEGLRKRMEAKIRKTDGCWLWEGSKTKKGYGQIGYRNRVRRAHRMAYELKHGEGSAEGAQVLHTCDNPPCVNPAHLFVGTPQDNTDDMVAKGRDDFNRQKARSRREAH